MRKVSVLAVAVAAVLGIAAIAYGATTTTTYKPVVTGAKGTIRAPAPLSVSLPFDIKNSDGSQPPAVTVITYYLDSHIVLNSSKFPTCSSTTLNRQKNVKACPAKSKLGSGLTQAQIGNPAPGQPPALIPFNVTAFNGPRGKLVLYVESKGLGIQRAIEGIVGRGPRGYGKQIRVAIPPDLQHPAGTSPSITSLSFKIAARIRVKGKTYGYFARTGCTGRKTKMGLNLTLRSNPSVIKNQTVACP